MNSEIASTDFLIIGAGLAGLTAAIKASEYGKVTIVSKTEFDESNSWLAQGGIAAALDEGDSPEQHFKDTVTAGRNLCNEEAVSILVNEGVERVRELIALGMEFDTVNGKLEFGLEGGHGKRRVLHSNGSATGKEIIKFLLSVARKNGNIRFLFETQVVELLKEDEHITGAVIFDRIKKQFYPIKAKAVIVASGGYSRIYSRNTNPDAAIGEGIILAYNAGAEIRDMEFVQFHPTAFYSEGKKTFLISEAVRGEGAILLNGRGERFMKKYSSLGELAPRDIVAKAIHEELDLTGSKFVSLDMRTIGSMKIKTVFKNIYELALKAGVDITETPVPVAPAAHYTVGGIKTDLEGRTNIKGLYACGETASTGVHGANRLASNSLLECLVFGKRAADTAGRELREDSGNNLRVRDYFIDYNSIAQFIRGKLEISDAFSKYVGIVRTEEGLLKAEEIVEQIASETENCRDDIFLKLLNGLTSLSKAVLYSAFERKESRGCHYRKDFPAPDEKYHGNFIYKQSQLKFEELL